LLSNVALAVSPNILYVKVKVENQFLIFAKELLGTVLSDELHFTVVAEFQGNELSGTPYVPLFGDGQPTVVLAEFVNTAEGTALCISLQRSEKMTLTSQRPKAFHSCSSSNRWLL